MTDNNNGGLRPIPEPLTSNASPAARHQYARDLEAYLSPEPATAPVPTADDKAARVAAFHAELATLTPPANFYEQAKHAITIERLIQKYNLT